MPCWCVCGLVAASAGFWRAFRAVALVRRNAGICLALAGDIPIWNIACVVGLLRVVGWIWDVWVCAAQCMAIMRARRTFHPAFGRAVAGLVLGFG